VIPRPKATVFSFYGRLQTSGLITHELEDAKTLRL